MHTATLTLLILLPTQTDPADTAEKPLTGWQALFQQHAREWKIHPADEPAPRFKVIERPLAFWSQPVRGGATGAVYLWRDANGRAAVVGTLFIWPHPSGSEGISHELHSLRVEPIRGDWRGLARWNVARPGIEWMQLKEPVPGESATQRLFQMRALAKEFSAKSYDREDTPWQLRLINRPLHRYELTGATDCLDGALFSFVQGTDTELLLLIEAKQDANKASWRFAFAPMTDYRLEVERNKEIAWKAGYREFDIWDQPYVASTVEVRDAADEEPSWTIGD